MIEIKHLDKVFRSKEKSVEAVKDVSLTVADGEIYGVIGYSGAGKSTLVRCINLLERPDAGEILIDGEPIFSRGRSSKGRGYVPRSKKLNGMRKKIGMIFQHFNLFDRSTVFDNVAYSLKYSGLKRSEIQERVYELLQLVDLTDKINAYPSQLSGGQKQRVAIARALANHPKVLLSDEATSALDPDATESILNLLKDLNAKLGLSIVIITHEMSVIKLICQRVAVMEKGAVVEEGEVYEVFSHPKQNITKKFIASVSPLEKVHSLIEVESPLVAINGKAVLVKLIFERDCVGEALISNISRIYNVDVNIVLANVDIIQGQPLGGMIAAIGGGTEEIKQALAFFESNGVKTEVIVNGGVF
jgi:D-methionine transport system ATP-binding protein